MLPTCNGHKSSYPNPDVFRVVQRNDSFGKGVICYRSFEPGDLISEIKGAIIHEMTQHSLQVEPGTHLLDLDFTGYFLHSCSPNVFLDMTNRLVYAVRPIRPYDYLEMDYAQTEDVLFKQFACHCGSSECRGWITGSAEVANEEDADYQEFVRLRTRAA